MTDGEKTYLKLYATVVVVTNNTTGWNNVKLDLIAAETESEAIGIAVEEVLEEVPGSHIQGARASHISGDFVRAVEETEAE